MSYTRGEKERRIMEKSGILKNKLFLYLTEFFDPAGKHIVHGRTNVSDIQCVIIEVEFLIDRIDRILEGFHDFNSRRKK